MRVCLFYFPTRFQLCLKSVSLLENTLFFKYRIACSVVYSFIVGLGFNALFLVRTVHTFAAAKVVFRFKRAVVFTNRFAFCR